MMVIKKGVLVEFTDDYYRSYPPKDESKIRYGICIADSDENTCQVELADNSVVKANFIYSYAWAGWVPEGLDTVFEKYNPYEEYDDAEE